MNNNLKALALLESISHKDVDNCSIIEHEQSIEITFFNKNGELTHKKHYENSIPTNHLYKSYHENAVSNVNGCALKILSHLILRDEVPEGFWKQQINIHLSKNNWSSSASIVNSQAIYEKIEFDEENPFFSPDFIIIGTMKGGTSSLYDYLCLHPKIITRHPKELHFFTHHYDLGIKEYRKFFAQKSKYLKIGEASPSYFDWSTIKIAKRIEQDTRDTQLFLLLADPVKRTISQYYHELRIKKKIPLGQEFVQPDEILTVKKLKDDIASGNDQYIKAGHYVERIPYWETFLKKDQLNIFTLKSLSENPGAIVNQALKSLGLNSVPINIEKVEKSNVNTYPAISHEAHDFLSDLFYASKQKLEQNYAIKL